MSSDLDLADPTAVALTIFRAFRASRIEAALYGGLALAAYGEPRETRHADFAVVGVAGPDAIGALVGVGLNPADLVEPRSPRFARAALERAVTGSLRMRPRLSGRWACSSTSP